MEYCEKSDLEARFGKREIFQLSHRGSETNPHGTDEDANARLAATIEDATAEMNGYLSKCYDLAVLKAVYDADKKIPRLVALCADITRYRLYDTLTDEDHEAARRYKNAIEALKTICGETLYDSEDVVIVKGSSSSSILVEERCRLMPDQCCAGGSCCDDGPDYGLT